MCIETKPIKEIALKSNNIKIHQCWHVTTYSCNDALLLTEKR